MLNGFSIFSPADVTIVWSFRQRRRIIEAVEARQPRKVWRVWLIVYRTELTVSLCAVTGKIVLVTLCIQIEWRGTTTDLV